MLLAFAARAWRVRDDGALRRVCSSTCRRRCCTTPQTHGAPPLLRLLARVGGSDFRACRVWDDGAASPGVSARPRFIIIQGGATNESADLSSRPLGRERDSKTVRAGRWEHLRTFAPL